MDKYYNLEFIQQQWIINRYNIVPYLERNGIIKNENGVKVFDPSKHGMFKCRDGSEEPVYICMDGEEYILKEFWKKLMVIGKNWNPPVLDRINNLK